MKLILAGTVLADDFGGQPVSGFQVNGQLAVESVQIVRAAGARHYPRGNQTTTLSWQSSREFPTLAAAEVYALTILSVLPPSGLLECVCGAPGEAPASVFFEGACLSAQAQGGYSGVRASVGFQVVAGRPATDAPPQLIQAGNAMILSGLLDLTAGADAAAVAFSAAQAGAPKSVVATYVKPTSGGANVAANVVGDSISPSGFGVELTAGAEAGGKLSWSAFF